MMNVQCVEEATHVQNDGSADEKIEIGKSNNKNSYVH